MIAAHVAGFLQIARYRLGHETLLQDDVEKRFREGDIPYEREKILGPADRVDFLVDGHIAVELKIKAQKRRIFRQMERYALHDCVDSLILVTAAPAGMPAALNGKPVYVVKLGMSGL